MIVWLPYHDRGWHVRSVDTNAMIAGQKIFKPWGRDGLSVLYGGTIYYRCFDTEQHAWNYAHGSNTTGMLNVKETVEKNDLSYV